MTIFSLGSACDLEHFSSLTQVGGNSDYQPIVPMNNSGGEFGNSSYNWKSDSTATIDMTTRDSSLFNAVSESGNAGHVNFGPDVWGSSTDKYVSENPLLNNNLGERNVQEGNIMPNMRPQSAYMPTSRTQFVKNEDENGRDLTVVSRKKPKTIVIPLPPFDKKRIQEDQKNMWIFIIIAFILVCGGLLYKTKYAS
jgi:hypothetical protein